MNYLKQATAMLAAAGLIVASAAAAQPQAPAKGSSVTLTSCVEKGQKDDTYVLTHVADVPTQTATDGSHVVYWFDKDTAKKLKSHVGHQIRIAATVSDVEKGEIEIDSTDEGIMVEIEGPGRDVRTTPNKAGVPAATAMADRDLETTVVKLKVNELAMVADKCLLAR